MGNFGNYYINGWKSASIKESQNDHAKGSEDFSKKIPKCFLGNDTIPTSAWSPLLTTFKGEICLDL